MVATSSGASWRERSISPTSAAKPGVIGYIVSGIGQTPANKATNAIADGARDGQDRPICAKDRRGCERARSGDCGGQKNGAEELRANPSAPEKSESRFLSSRSLTLLRLVLLDVAIDKIGPEGRDEA